MRFVLPIGLMLWMWQGAVACSSGGGASCAVDEDCASGNFCRNGDCTFDCTLDGDCPTGYRCSARGRCEPGCVKTNGGVEACDGLDNDCDGDTDEAFPELGQACQNGGCPAGVWVCAAGGQGVSCNGAQPAADDASCDGLDDDCDGDTDEDAAPRACPLQQGVCVGSTQACGAGGVWDECDYGPDYTVGVDDSCDRVDNDCDGDTDEDRVLLLVPESGPQADDGLDNNCNGLVDEPGGVMVPEPFFDGVWIDAYEVGVFENPDCTGQQYGVSGNDYPPSFPPVSAPTTPLYACSLPNITPSAYLTWYQARFACEAQGKRLCRALEWGVACNGDELISFPYGVEFVQGACNDAWGGTGALAASGAHPDCHSRYRTFDMSGNLAEWIFEWDTDCTDCAWTGGFHYQCELCEYSLGCQACDGTSDDLDKVIRVSDCVPDGFSRECFLRTDQRPILGTRCCLDGP